MQDEGTWMQTPETNFTFPMPSAWQWFVGAVATAWLATPSVWRVLISLMIFDFCTGMIAASYQKRFSLNSAWWGLIRKGLEVWLLLSVQLLADLARLPPDVTAGLVLTFALYELCSAAKNCGRVGVAIQPVVAVIARVKAAVAGEAGRGKRR